MLRSPKRSLVAVAALLANAVHAQSACPDEVFMDGLEERAKLRFGVTLTIRNLDARSASFRLDGDEILIAEGDGQYCFVESVAAGSSYAIDIIVQPTFGSACASENLSGIATGPIQIDVDCGNLETSWDAFEWDDADWN